MKSLQRIITSLFTSSLFRYVFVGGLSYAIELSLLLSLVYLLHLNEPTAITISFAVGLMIAFVLQKLFAFKNNEKSAKAVGRQSIYYTLLVIFNYFFTLIFTSVLSPLVGIAVARTLALIITTFWNYFIYKKVIFKQNR